LPVFGAALNNQLDGRRANQNSLPHSLTSLSTFRNQTKNPKHRKRER
jgi:hypothetical protein